MFNKIIIWGLKNSWHTHKHIHDAFHKAFIYLKYETYWVNNIKELNQANINLNNSFILFSGTDYPTEVPPINTSCFYFLHNVICEFKNKIINQLDINKYLDFQVYTNKCITYSIQIKDYPYHYFNKNENTLYFPWGTNLLPTEIENNIINYDTINIDNDNCFRHIGSLGGDWKLPYIELANYLNTLNIKFETAGGYPNLIDEETTVKLLKKTNYLPALQFKWQLDNGYIPCRIFKNISYGKMGITNNIVVNKLFDNKLIYDINIKKLADKAIEFNNNPNKKSIIINLMNNVKDNHTYVSRIKLIMNIIETYKKDIKI